MNGRRSRSRRGRRSYPRANLNHVQFPEVTGDAVRVNVTHAGGAKTGIKEVQVFSTGVEAPPSTNQAPLVTAWEDAAASTAGEAALVGTAKDDGLPAGELDIDWSIVSAPDGATVLFDDPHAASTVARFSTEGAYVLRLTASDGETSSSVDVTVQGEAPTRGANVAPDATPTAEYTAPWNNVNAVNNGTILYSGGAQSELWGTWSGSHPATRWLQYTWNEPVRVVGHRARLLARPEQRDLHGRRQRAEGVEGAVLGRQRLDRCAEPDRIQRAP